MSSIVSLLSGKKTYFVAAGMIAFGVIGLAIGKLDSTQGWGYVTQGLAFFFLRSGVTAEAAKLARYR